MIGPTVLIRLAHISLVMASKFMLLTLNFPFSEIVIDLSIILVLNIVCKARIVNNHL